MIVHPEAPKPGEVLPEVDNNPDIEKQWVVKAVKHSETFMRLVTGVPDPSKLKLTRFVLVVIFAYFCCF